MLNNFCQIPYDSTFRKVANSVSSITGKPNYLIAERKLGMNKNWVFRKYGLH